MANEWEVISAVPFDSEKHSLVESNDPWGIASVEDIAEEPGRITTGVSNFGRGVADIVSGIPKSVSIQHAQNADKALSIFDRMDGGELQQYSPAENDTAFGFELELSRYRSGTPEERAEIRKRVQDARDPRNSDLYKAGKWLDDVVADALPVNEEYQDEFWATKFSRGLGSMVGFTGVGLVGRAAGFGTLATTGTSGMALGSVEGFEDAVRNGASLKEAYESANLNGVVGVSEALPISRMFKRLDDLSGGTVGTAIKEAVKEGTEEAIQEAFQTVMGNVIANNDALGVGYDPDRGTFEGSGEGAAVGFTTGGVVGFITSLVFGRRGGHNAGDETPPPPGIRENAAPAPLTEADHNSPIPDELIQRGNEEIADTDAIASANESLSRSGLPEINTHVDVDLGDGRGASRGVVTDAFEYDDPVDVGEKVAGVTIEMADGRKLHKTASEIAATGIQITPAQEETPVTPSEEDTEATAPEAPVAPEAPMEDATPSDPEPDAAQSIDSDTTPVKPEQTLDDDDPYAPLDDDSLGTDEPMPEEAAQPLEPQLAKGELPIIDDRERQRLENIKAMEEAQKDKPKAIGQNIDGDDIFEDDRGVRHIVRDGFKHTEKVGIKPDGSISVTRDDDTYLTDDERAPAKEEQVKTSASDSVVEHFRAGGKFKNIVEARKFVRERDGELDDKAVEEAVEAGVVKRAREIVAEGNDASETYQRLVDLYSSQPNLNTRTSTSIENQAYSTPAPLAYLASHAAGIDQNTTVYEPTAGNGMLLIGADPSKSTANELNPDRVKSLEGQGFKPSQGDAMEHTPSGKVDVVIANPPFGSVLMDDGKTNKTFPLSGTTTNKIDEAISLRALESMKDDGRAVLIIGSKHGRNVDSTPQEAAIKYRSGRKFFKKLYDGYNVIDHYTVDGKLYNKQGAQWPVDVIVIEGRGGSKLDLPMKTAPQVLKSWDDLRSKLDGSNRLDTAEQQDGDGNDSVTERSEQAPDAGSLQGGAGVANRPDDSEGVSGSGSGNAENNGRAGEPTDGQQPESGRGDTGGEQRPPDVDGGTRNIPNAGDGSGEQSSGPSNDEGGNAGGLSGDSVSVDPFDDIFDSALNEAFGEEVEKTAPKEKPKAGKAAKSAAVETAKGLDDVTAGLAALFGADPNRVNSGLSFDKDTYEKAKPLFIAGVSHFKTAGADVSEMVKALVGHLATVAKLPRETIERMRPYVKQFIEDVKSGVVDLAEKVTPKKKAQAKKEDPYGLTVPEYINVDNVTNRQEILDAEEQTDAREFVAEIVKRKIYENFESYDPESKESKAGIPWFYQVRKKWEDKYDSNADYVSASWEKAPKGADASNSFKGWVLADVLALNQAIKEYRKLTNKRPERKAPEKATDRVNEEVETDFQVQYEPTSQARYAVGTLVPRNMQTAMTSALDELKERVGDIDAYVADKLDYSVDEVVGTDKAPGYFSAEQVDALALAIDNVENGGGFIVGDQTGVGKGRFVAGMLKYAMMQGKTPIFVTKSPGLFADMVRDMRDIGMNDISDRVMVTNNGLRNDKAIPLDADNAEDVLSSMSNAQQKSAMEKIESTGELPDGSDILFTNYSQMQYIKGQDNVRMRAVQALAPNAVIVLDESHLAGGSDAPRRINPETGEAMPTGADFVREVLEEAHGVVYSSATYAKNPAVMSLYFKTDISLGVDNIGDLAETIRAGGVPLQQVVANMLVESGQYARRERSFDGVSIEQRPLPTDHEAADIASDALRNIFTLDKDLMTEAREAFIESFAQAGAEGATDNAVGETGATQTGFSSIMHNVINQMLLALKAEAAVDLAIELHKNGEKPIIALANTNEQIMQDYISDHNIAFGDEINVPFNTVLERYVHRLRRITIKDENDEKQHITMTDEQVAEYGGADALSELKRVEQLVKEANLSHLPGSPIDYIAGRLKKAGVNVGEITGRSIIIEDGRLTKRAGSEAEKKRIMNGYNSGELDSLIINQSGSTGYSMHATDKAGNDGKQRHLIVLQPDGNIDVFMQILGRIHRTGQIKLPNYTIGISDLSVEKRLAAVLMRKMASLNANTTASKDSAVSLKESVDFLNRYGDEIVQEYLTENPEIASMTDMEEKATDGIAAKFTGRLAIIEPEVVEKIYDEIEANYVAHIEALDRMGMNTLEAKTLELDAKTIDEMELVPAVDDGDSPFTGAAVAETVDVKKLGKPFTEEELKAEGEKILDGKSPSDFVDEQIAEIKAKMPPYIETIDKKIDAAEQLGQELMLEADAKAAALAEARGEEYNGVHKSTAKERKASETKALWELNKRTAQAKLNVILDKLEQYKPGKSLRIRVADGENAQYLYAVSLGVNIKGVSHNPTAASSYKVRFAIADSGREITIPLSKIVGEEASYSTEAVDQSTVLGFFRDGFHESRETRQMITGNLLRGYAQFKKGQIVMFTREDGSIEQGILMPKEFDTATELAKQPVEFKAANQVLEFLRDGLNRRVHSKDEVMSFTYERGMYGGAPKWKLQVKTRGGKSYYLNKAVRKLTGDFVKRKGVMSVEIKSENDLRKIFDIYQENLGTRYETKTHKPEARAVTGQEIKGEDKGQEKFSRRDDLRADVLDRLPRIEAELQERLKALGLSGKIALRFVEAIKARNEDGSFSLADGVYHRKLIRIAMDTLDKTFTFNHEIIHALRDLGVLRDMEWRKLEQAALADTQMMDRVRRENEGANLTEEQLIEEAVANMFGERNAQNGGFFKRAMKRISAFFKAVRAAFSKEGYKTAEDIFEGIEEGYVGRRSGKGRGGVADRMAYSRRFEHGVEMPKRDSEARWRDATNGVSDASTLVDRLNEWFDAVIQGFSRHYKHLPNDRRFANVKEQLRKMEAAPQAAKDDIVRMLRDITEGMTPADLDLFTRKVVLEDLLWEAQNDHDLPFGLKDEAGVREALAAVDSALQGRADLQEKLRKRQALSSRIAAAMVEAGVLTKEQVANPSYYRHMVLEHARSQNAFVSDATKKIKSPFWFARKGSKKDINANLLEAEFDWMHKALVDIQTAKTIEAIKKSKLNIRDKVVAAAKRLNAEMMQRLINEDIDKNGYDKLNSKGEVERTSPMNEQMKAYKQQIAMGLNFVAQALEDNEIRIPARFESTVEGLLDKDAESGGELFPFLTWLLDNGLPGSNGAAVVYKAVNARKAWVKESLGSDYTNPLKIDELIARGLAPEGYTSWQPEEGKILYTAQTLSEHAQQKMLRTIMQSPSDYMPKDIADVVSAELSDHLTESLVVGGDKYKLIIPEELAVTLDSMRDVPASNALSYTTGKTLSAWKIWTLINPRRVIKYNLNNLSGDLDAVIAGNPSALKHMGQAIRELTDVMLKGNEPSARYREAVDRGVFDSGMSIQEVPDISFLGEFEHLRDQSNRLDKLSARAIKKIWRGMKKGTQWRENWLRYAAYLDYAERLEAGESMESVGYGAAIPEIVDNVHDNKDKAALLARELVGDYGNVSEIGQGLRRHVMPFYSWIEINTKRYWRLNANAWSQGVAKGAATSGGLAVAKGARFTAWAYIRMAMVYGLVSMWNNLFFGDEEEELDEADRVRLHINLGKWDGEIHTIKFQGALSDFMGWVGFEDAMTMYLKIDEGKADWGDVAEKIYKAPVNRLVSAVRPDFKLPVELLGEISFYPDAFEPSSLRDGWRHTFRTFSFEHEYDLVAGKPSRGYAQSLKNTVVYTRDPNEVAYNAARKLAIDWNQERLGMSGSGGYHTERGDLVYQIKKAVRFKDKAVRAAKEQELRDLIKRDNASGLRKRTSFEKVIQSSVKRAHPLYRIPKGLRMTYLRTLSSADRRALNTAIQWWEKVYK